MRAKVESMLAANQLPPCYTEHKSAREASDGELVIPAALYTDGIAHEKNELAFLVCIAGTLHRARIISWGVSTNPNSAAADAKRGAAYTR